MKRYRVTIGEHQYEVTLSENEKVRVNGKEMIFSHHEPSRNLYPVSLDNRSLGIVAVPKGSVFEVLVSGQQARVDVESERDTLLKKFLGSQTQSHGRDELHAPMPALVVRVEVAIGDAVEAGQGLIILEAMKMENELRSHKAGTVKEIHVSSGTPVEKGQLLIVLE